MGKKLNFNKWVEKFCPNFDVDTHVFETFGEDLEKVKNMDDKLVWTIVTGDNEELYISQGFRYVNRLNYIIAEIPRKEGEIFNDFIY